MEPEINDPEKNDLFKKRDKSGLFFLRDFANSLPSSASTFRFLVENRGPGYHQVTLKLLTNHETERIITFFVDHCLQDFRYFYCEN